MKSVTSQRVESFRLELSGFSEMLSQADSIAAIEAQLLMRLENPIRLLRWAIVEIEKDSHSESFYCEGAYLKQL